jgi:phosphoribosyl 1,2-cyclic phosphate phosphodiesterase
MRLQYFGTAAAEGFPALFCHCDVCKRAWKAGGKNIRTRSQALVDDMILIDFPADTYMHVLQGGLDLTRIEHCLITHHHSDHLCVADFTMRRRHFAYPDDMPPLHVYGTSAVEAEMETVLKKVSPAISRLLFHRITPFVPFKIGSYLVIPLKANHASALEPVIYLIGQGEKNLLYAHDTGSFPAETLEYLKSRRIRMDLLSLDCTNGLLTGCRDYHLGLDTAAEATEQLKENGNADSLTKVCVNHFSHNGLAIYDEMLPAAEKYKFLVSYDGMTVHF